MAYLWGGMILLGVIYGALTGNLQEITESIISSSGEAVSLCITMAGLTAFWTGLMRIAEKTGLINQLTKCMKPIIKLLFPRLPENSKASNYISVNFLSNILGLSWASTSSGLMAFKELEKRNREECQKYGENKKRGIHIASQEMCTFLIINVSSLQLIPVSIIAYRAQYGSAQPAAIVGPAILATSVSTLTAVVFCLIKNRRHIE